MLHNLPSLYVFGSMSESSLNFIYKRAYAVVNILKFNNVLWIYSIRHKEIPLHFIFYYLQIIPDIPLLFIYIALSITETVHNLSVFMDYVPDEVLYVLTSALLKLLL